MIPTGDDAKGLATLVGGSVVAVIATLFGAREWLKSRVLTDTNRDAAINGVEINNGVLINLQKEMVRLTERVAELEGKVDALTDKLANVRLIALDCYQLATDCECEWRERLLAHLKQIIKDA